MVRWSVGSGLRWDGKGDSLASPLRGASRAGRAFDMEGFVCWAKHQPKDGDLILVCCHEHRMDYHWFVLDMGPNGEPLPLEFKRPDGGSGSAKWACICDRCIQSDPDPHAHIRGERIWTGDAPAIRAENVERTQPDAKPN